MPHAITPQQAQALERAPIKGGKQLVLNCTPPDAAVSMDGVPQGTCADFSGEPNGLKLGNRSHHVEVKKSGFFSWETWVDSDGARLTLNVVLVPKEGSSL